MRISKAYVDNDLVDDYDERHFGGEGGRYVFKKETAVIDELLSHAVWILDAPCGTGIYTAHYARKGFQVVGADASMEMLRRSQARQGPTSLVLCDINHLPFRDNSFEAAIMIRLSQHLPRQETQNILGELRRVIRVGGRVIFDTLRWSPRSVSPDAPDGMHVYTLKQAEELIASAGLTKVKAVSAFLFSALRYRKLPVWLIKILEMVEKAVPPFLLLRTFWACERLD